jgi:hypothetical protein
MALIDRAAKRESIKALRAFEDYWNMGEGRSLDKLVKVYQAQPECTPTPTRHLKTLKGWSSAYDWQERLRERDLQDLEETRRRYGRRAKRMRDRLLTAIEAEVGRYIQDLEATDKRLLLTDAAALEKLVKLHQGLSGQSLAERINVTHGGPTDQLVWTPEAWRKLRMVGIEANALQPGDDGQASRPLLGAG